MKTIAVIPARQGSTRFPGKPLAIVAGKPLLQWVIEATQKCPEVTKTLVATDHGSIFDLANQVGAEAVMTDSGLPSGSDRVYAAVLNEDADVILNVQGDEPLLQPEALSKLIQPFEELPELEMATLCGPLQDSDLENKNVVKVIRNQQGFAIYFSRFGIPYSRLDPAPHNAASFKHVGLYGYSLPALKAFCRTRPTPLELAESLEQLRALEMGMKIKVEYLEQTMHGVDTPEDIPVVEKALTNSR